MAGDAKLERLLNLTAALLETSRPLTAAEIAKRVPGYRGAKDALRRAFERDKEDLREMGIPLEVVELADSATGEVGYRIPKDEYYLRDPGLESDELAALQLAAAAVRLDGVEGTGALWKLGGSAAPAAGPPAELAALPADDRLVALFGAVRERRAVTFAYRDERRIVDPYRLDFLRGRWYLTGFDHDRADERHFRLDRFAGGVEAGAPGAFDRPSTAVPGARLQPWELGEGDAVVARVLVDADQAPLATLAVGSSAVGETRADGSVVLALEVTNADGFRSFVLGFLDHAEVLAPPELRADLVAWLQTVAES